MKKSKRYLEIKSKIEDRSYSLNDSVNLIKDISSAKFDESVDLNFVFARDCHLSHHIVMFQLARKRRVL